MQKRCLVCFVVVQLIFLGMTATSFAGNGHKCVIESISEDATVSVTCKNADSFKAGDVVKLLPSRKEVKCTVIFVAQDGHVSVDCRRAEKLKVGDKIKLTSSKKKEIKNDGC